MKKIWMLFLLLLACSLFFCQASAQEGLQGKKLSILGDSISTYAGISDDSSKNSTIANNEPYYQKGAYGVYQADTWWQQAIDLLDMELLVNNSWAGSCAYIPQKGMASVGCITRCENLHTDDGQTPDIIAVYMGTNDWYYACNNNPYILGSEKAISYDKLIADAGDGTYVYAVPATVCEAYAVILHKIKTKYPQADVYCMTALPQRDPHYISGNTGTYQTSGFNDQICALAERFGCKVVDLENCGITKHPENFDPYFMDYATHPNAQGMDLITKAFVSAVLGRNAEIYDIEIQSPNAGLQMDLPRVVFGGEAFELRLVEAEKARDITVTVTMGGTDVSASCYADGLVSIPAVTGDVYIEAVENSHNYLWKMQDGQFVNVPGWENKANEAALLAGGNVNDLFYNARYALADPVELLHYRKWALEWKGTGRGMAVFAPESSFTLNEPYFFRHQDTQLFAFGVYDGSGFHNYGILLPADIDCSQEHIFRLENHVYSYGGNMVYLYVDGREIGPLNTYFIGYTSQGVSDNWISGKDFVLGYLGAETIPMSGMSMEYLQVWEDDAPSARCEHVEIIDMGVEPSCIQAGLSSGSHCALCTLTLIPQQIIPAVGHTLERLPAVEPTCEEDGLTSGLRCAVCEEILMEQTVLKATGHTEAILEAVEPSCTEIGLKQGVHCSTCRAILQPQEIIPATGHTMQFEQDVYVLEAGGEALVVRAELSCGHEVPLLFSSSLEMDVESIEPASAALQGRECGVAVLTAETQDEAGTRAQCRVIVHGAQKLTLPPNMNHVAEEAFTGLAVQEVVLGENVRSIASRAFADCADLRLIQLPEGAEIAEDAFAGCDQLTILCREESTGLAYAQAQGIPYILLP